MIYISLSKIFDYIKILYIPNQSLDYKNIY